jgi:undecaprenyl-diphosphatase
MTTTEAIILGALEGLTEFLPISSSGHLIVVREWLGIPLVGGLAFDAALQGAATLAIVVYFWKDLWGYARALLSPRSPLSKEAFYLVLATIPALVLGILVEPYLEGARSAYIVAITLIVGSFIMVLGELSYATRKAADQNLSALRALCIGFFQSLALLPGMSRSGMTMVGGMVMGLSREHATRVAFLLGAPLLLGSAGKKIVDMFQGTEGAIDLYGLLVASAVAFVVGLAVIHFLLKYLRTHTLWIFIWYRVALALLILATIT